MNRMKWMKEITCIGELYNKILPTLLIILPGENEGEEAGEGDYCGQLWPGSGQLGRLFINPFMTTY